LKTDRTLDHKYERSKDLKRTISFYPIFATHIRNGLGMPEIFGE